MINLTEAAKRPVTFKYYRDKSLWYSTYDDKIFPVPVEDAGSATFNSTEKGILLMRWMRKWNESNSKGQKYSEMAN